MIKLYSLVYAPVQLITCFLGISGWTGMLNVFAFLLCIEVIISLTLPIIIVVVLAWAVLDDNFKENWAKGKAKVKPSYFPKIANFIMAISLAYTGHLILAGVVGYLLLVGLVFLTMAQYKGEPKGEPDEEIGT